MPGESVADEIAAAEARGEAQAKLSALVASHERRLNAINGSIARNAEATESLRRTVEDVASRMATQAKLDEYKTQQEEKARSWDQVKFGAFAGGAFVVLAALISALVVILG